MEGEQKEQRYSEREKQIIRIRVQLRQNEMFMENAGNNEGMRKILLEQREKLEGQLKELEQQENQKTE